jgi:hypothetical protein
MIAARKTLEFLAAKSNISSGVEIVADEPIVAAYLVVAA